jgi:hypothetical protein
MSQPGLVTLTWFRNGAGYERRDRQREGVPDISRHIANLPPYKDPNRVFAVRPSQQSHEIHLCAPACASFSPQIYVVGKDGPIDRYSLRVCESNVYLELANMPHTPGGVITFANRWGQLTYDIYWPHECHQPLKVEAGISAANDTTVRRVIVPQPQASTTGGVSVGVDVSIYYGLSALLRSTIASYPMRGLLPFEDALQSGFPMLQPRLRRNPGRTGNSLQYEVRTLSCFIAIEMAQALMGGADITACARCGTLRAKPKRGPAPKYCSNGCKQKAYRDRCALQVRDDASVTVTSTRRHRSCGPGSQV